MKEKDDDELTHDSLMEQTKEMLDEIRDSVFATELFAFVNKHSQKHHLHRRQLQHAGSIFDMFSCFFEKVVINQADSLYRQWSNHDKLERGNPVKKMTGKL